VPGQFTMCFGVPDCADVTCVAVRDLDEFDAVTRLVGQLARKQAMSIQVDLQAAPPGAGDPVLVQFLVGDDGRSSLLWHEDGAGFAAVDPHLPQRSYGVPYTHFHEVECAPPDETQVTQATARDAVAVYLLTGKRTKWLAWREVAAD
jgi:hypothetical protein